MKDSKNWRLILNPQGDPVHMLAYPNALLEGRIAGKYMLSSDIFPDTIVVQGFGMKGIIAGADIEVNTEAAQKENIKVVKIRRAGRGGPQPVGTLDYSELTKNASNKFQSVSSHPEDPAVILYTSGTTDKPKGVILTHKNFIAQTQMVNRIMPMKQEDRIILVLPLFHVYGLSNGLICGLGFGCALSLIPQYSPGKLLENILSVKATILIAIPTMYIHILLHSKRRNAEMPKSLRLCVSGGAPLSLATINEFMKEFDTQIAEGYGLTETTSAVSLNKSGETYRPGSIGLASPQVYMKIVDENGNELEDGTEGEIVIKGDMVTKGYWNKEEETKEVIKEGWLYTGDLGYRDGEGYFFITDRKKDIIIRGGFNISPREVEEVLMSHPAVLEAAVVSVPDKREREAVKGFIVLRKDYPLNAKELLDFCGENLAEYKIPKFIEFVETLPKSATGKVLRRELRGTKGDDNRLILQEEPSNE